MENITDALVIIAMALSIIAITSIFSMFILWSALDILKEWWGMYG